MLLKYQRITLHARINTWLGSALLAAVGLWAGLAMWSVATGENGLVKAFSTVVQERTVLPE